MVDMDKIVSLSKRRGFIFQSSEIYGGTGSCWDYGPLGVELKNNVKRVWWRDNVQNRGDMVGLDASILMHTRVWKASGHLDHFTDPMVDSAVELSNSIVTGTVPAPFCSFPLSAAANSRLRS